ncbi:MAG TPA: glycosyltransferase family 9 protein [Chitinophagales bacterium]|nr:glycosyltransferase family 9 protein [Chitinophagales bacterium]HRK28661.1 glycosyltransferase family 9 protein [Chitinophagales bacterium]
MPIVLPRDAKILLSAYTGLGNFVLKTPLIQAWKTVYPHHQIDLIAGNGFGAEFVLQGSPLIGKTHILPASASIGQKIRFFYRLRQERYHLLLLPFDAQPNFLVYGSYLAGIPLRIRHLHPAVLRNRVKCAAQMPAAPKTMFVPVPPNRHETELNIDLLRFVYAQPNVPVFPTITHFTPDAHVMNRFELYGKPYLLLQPGAANGVYMAKIWHHSHFARLIQELITQFGNQYQIVLAGDKGDYDACITPLLNSLPDVLKPYITNTAGLTLLPELMTLISHARLVVCHDSGIMHLADAMQIPLIALYGPTDDTRTRPLKPSSEVLFSQSPHRAAMYYFAQTEADLAHQGIGQQAMDGILVQTVFEAIAGKLIG